MTAPNMATLTASLERSLRNCSLDSPSHAPPPLDHTRRHLFHPCLDLSDSTTTSSTTTTTTLVDLNSHISLPYHWEQCLDLQTGEIYYKNWSNGMKAKEDPRLISGCSSDGDEDDDEEDDEDDNEVSYDSEGSSTIEHYSSPPPPYNYSYNPYGGVDMRRNNNNNNDAAAAAEDVLVVAGCKGCLMYYMVPKHVLDCPKCTGQLLHFDRSGENIASN